jgi:DNA repair protein RadC
LFANKAARDLKTLLILVHNHPRDPTPSRMDIEMTRVIVEVASGGAYSNPEHAGSALQNLVLGTHKGQEEAEQRDHRR